MLKSLRENSHFPKRRPANSIDKGALLCKEELLPAGHWEKAASDALGMLVAWLLRQWDSLSEQNHQECVAVVTNGKTWADKWDCWDGQNEERLRR